MPELDLARLSGDSVLVFAQYDVLDLLLEAIGPRGGSRPTDILEAGCGSGKFSISCALRIPNVRCIGVDISADSVFYARKLAQMTEHTAERRLPVAFCQLDFMASPSPFHENQFDFVFNEGTPEHFGRIDERRQRYFDLCAKLASKKVIIFVPNLDCKEQQKVSETTHHHYEGCTDIEEDFNAAELHDRLAASGLRTVLVRPVTPGPIEKSRFLMGVGSK